jgi:hypothetical protein
MWLYFNSFSLFSQIAHYKDLASRFFQMKGTKRSAGSQLQHDMSQETKQRLKEIYTGHNQKLVELFKRYDMMKESGKIRENGWDLWESVNMWCEVLCIWDCISSVEM